MKYFETKHEKDSAKITILLSVILLLLLFVVGPPYMDPPEEFGVAVNFGTTDFGRGNIQPKKPIKSEPQKIEEQPQVTESQPETSKPQESAKEDVITQESEESIAIRKQKEADAKAKADAERVAKQKREAEERKRKEQEAQKKKLDALIGGVSKSEGSETGGEGNDNRDGDKGQLDGDPYAPSYFGDPGTGSGGVGYGLNGRGRATYTPFKQDCNESGTVVVRIEVDRNGRVIKAEPGVRGTNNNASCLLAPAKKIALSHKWRANSKAPARQIGFVSINFKLGQ